MDRRVFIASLAASATAGTLIRPAFADVPVPYTWDEMPPMDSQEKFIAWAVKNRGEDPKYLAERFDRFRHLVGNRDTTDAKDKRAFLMTPREGFCPEAEPRPLPTTTPSSTSATASRSPARTLSARMTQVIDVKPGDKVLEIGTGSGYQSAYLSYLTDKVWTIEIIKPLSERTTVDPPGPDRQGLYRIQGDPLRRTPTATTAGRTPGHSTRSSSPAASTTCPRRCCSS